jgi:hypothetical protein
MLRDIEFRVDSEAFCYYLGVLCRPLEEPISKDRQSAYTDSWNNCKAPSGLKFGSR